MSESLTHAVEDYLKAIYKLQAVHGKATTSQLAEQLSIAPASVTGMVKKLAETDPPLILYARHRGVTLTREGEKAALEILRHHRLLEQFLHQVLGFSWDQVHEEAERLEHVISEEFEARIAQVLGDPLHDPHGDPIPRMDLTIPPSSRKALRDLRPGQQAVIQRVRDTDSDLLCWLEEQGLVPQVRIEVIDFSPFDDNLSIQIAGEEDVLILGPRITSQIFVDISGS